MNLANTSTVRRRWRHGADANRVVRGALAWTAAAAVLLGCATQTDRVILLPGAGDRPTGAVTVRSSQDAGKETVLDQAYAQATVAGVKVEPSRTTAAQVQADFGKLLAQQPLRAVQWVLNFETGGNELTPDSKSALEQVLAAVAQYRAGDIVVTGHTDSVGSQADNDRLSLSRAQVIRQMLVAAGVAADRISVAGRGERQLLVPTPDEVAEPRNRRVEIKLR
jgi:outer membrane protein OmpA-like peptidoglycan-associated protein